MTENEEQQCLRELLAELSKEFGVQIPEGWWRGEIPFADLTQDEQWALILAQKEARRRQKD